MAAKKKLLKKPKSTAKRPSVSRAKPTPKPCCGRLRGHAPGCTGEAAEPQEPIVAAAPAVAEEDAEAPVQPGPYLAALRGIEESLASIVSLLNARQAAPAAPQEAQPAAPRARKPKPAPEAQPAAGEPQEAAPAAPEATLPCCGARLAAGIHKSDCPVAYPKAAPAPEKAPPAKQAPAQEAPVTVEQVRSAFLAFASRKGRDAAVALLGEFGASKVAEVPADRFGEFVAALKVA